jgi:hypothetical protein
MEFMFTERRIELLGVTCHVVNWFVKPGAIG